MHHTVLPSSLGGLAEKLARRMALVEKGDEPRVLRSGKAGRVAAPRSEMSRFGLAAGTVSDGGGLFGPRVTGSEARLRTAFSTIDRSTRDAVALATSFKLMGPPKFDKPKNDAAAAEVEANIAHMEQSAMVRRNAGRCLFRGLARGLCEQ